VVQVLHPGVRARVAADLDLLAAAAWALEQLPRLGLQYLSLRQLVGEFDKVRSVHLKTQRARAPALGLVGLCFFALPFPFSFTFSSARLVRLTQKY